MALSDWPTLGDMILRQQRVVVFMDYKADQVAVPYILDEFSQLWETPFSPTDPAFPCTTQRPPGLTRNQSLERMYMANHNLNQEVSLLGSSLLVPNTAVLNTTNGVTGAGSLGNMSEECTGEKLYQIFSSTGELTYCPGDWNRPPNFLLVDYYNRGDPMGSVFQVAANANGVTYNKACCGSAARSAATALSIKISHLFASLSFVLLVMLI